MNILFLLFEIIGTVAFSISGVMVALNKKMDLLGVVFLGFTTAVGGGILRDIVLGKTPPTAFLNPIYSSIAFVTSFVLFFIFRKKRQAGENFIHTKLFLIIDSLGLAVFTVVGIQTSQKYGLNIFLNVFTGVITGVGGGVMRDLISCQMPYIFTKHFYATASIIGAVLYIITNHFINPTVAGIVGISSIFLLRIFASKFLWGLPKAKQDYNK